MFYDTGVVPAAYGTTIVQDVPAYGLGGFGAGPACIPCCCPIPCLPCSPCCITGVYYWEMITYISQI